jgi:anti-sigma factor RsiW
MSDKDRIAHDRDCGADVAAYALGALDAAEAEEFREHLNGCVVCQDELSAFAEVVDVLPASAPAYRAPDGLRRRVLQAVAEESRPAPARPTAPGRARRRLALPRPALALGGAMALAVAAVVVVLVAGSSPSPKPRVIAAQVTGRGSASLRVSQDHAELVVHRLQAPPPGQIYEVWLQRGRTGAPIPTKALFGVNDKGDAAVDVPGSLHAVTLVMVTREPAGGTQKPTHPPVIRAVLD